MKKALVIVVLLCAGCGHSPPTRFYTLASSPGASQVSYGGPPVRLEAVHLPPSLAGKQMLHGTGPHEVEVRPLERWSDDLDYLLRQTLAQDLMTRLPHAALVFPDAPRPRGALSWVVDVLTLAELDGKLRCEVSFSLLGGDAVQVVERRQASFSTSVDGSAEATSKALSQVAGELADVMAGSLAEMAAGLVKGPGLPF